MKADRLYTRAWLSRNKNNEHHSSDEDMSQIEIVSFSLESEYKPERPEGNDKICLPGYKRKKF
jgi:hypothetical protein